VKQRVLPEEAPPAREKLTVVEVQETAVPESDGIPEQSAAPEPADSLAAALQHGKAALLERGDLATARGHFQAAARSALALGDIDCLGRAALGLGGLWVHEHRTAIEGSRVTAWQRRALEELAPGSQLAARLNLRLIAESDYARGRSTQVLAALDAARCGGDPVVLADALSLAHHCLLGPEHADRRLNLADELLAVAGLTGRTMDSVLGLLWRTVDLLLAADPHAQRSLRELAFVVAWSLPNTRKVYLNDYPANVFEGGGCGLLGIAGVGIDAHEGAVMTRWGERMNAAIATAARTFAGDPERWNLVGGLEQRFNGHAYCAAHSWFVWYEHSWRYQGNNKGTAHPNAAGQVANATLIRQAIGLG